MSKHRATKTLKQRIVRRVKIGVGAGVGTAVAFLALGGVLTAMGVDQPAAHAATSTTDDGTCMSLRWNDAVAVAASHEQGEDAAQARWDDLIKAGWYGSKTDGMEALWSPTCTDHDIAIDAPKIINLPVYGTRD